MKMAEEVDLTTALAGSLGMPVWAILLISIWSLAWMGIAMWKSARKNNTVWFLVFLFFHTFGILEILYIFLFSKMDFSGKKIKIHEKSKKKRS
jgi:hypothetical protein